MLKNYHYCSFCNSKNLKKLNSRNSNFSQNFYEEAISNDLNFNLKIIKKKNLYECKVCKIIQHKIWFDEKTAWKIYSIIYGQHNRSWENYIKFKKFLKLPDHGDLFNFLNRNFKIRSYGEYNSPFMGLFLNFFFKEVENKKNIKLLLDANEKYLVSRQVAGYSKIKKKNKMLNAKKLLKKVIKLKSKINSNTKKTLFIDCSCMLWGANDNYKSIDSKALASQIFDLDIAKFDEYNEKKKFDLFGIFHSLDHTFNSKKILDFALNKSNYVVVYCHVSKKLNSQHKFTFTEKFLKFLNSKNINVINLNSMINKSQTNDELYFLCSRKKISF